MQNFVNERPNAEPVPRSGAAGIVVDGHYAPPPRNDDGKQWVRTSAIVQRSAAELYELWHDIERAPEWQEQIASVTKTGERTTHWVMQIDDKKVEWDAEELVDEPGRRIAWRSTAGDVQQAGEVVFEEAVGQRGTRVTLLQEIGIGKLASAAATVANRSPSQGVVENLRHFKALAETGEIPRIEPQAHGPRGFVGAGKRSLYGETIPVPQGTSDDRPVPAGTSATA